MCHKNVADCILFEKEVSNICGDCKSGYELQSNLCHKNVDHCVTYSWSHQTRQNCLVCGEGRTVQHNICHWTVPNCDTYSGEASGECTDCENQYVLGNNRKRCH